MQQEKRQQQVKSARVSPLAFSSIASKPRNFSYTPKRSVKCTFCVAIALGHALQETGEILSSKSGLAELNLLLSATLPIGPVKKPHQHKARQIPREEWHVGVSGGGDGIEHLPDTGT